MTQRDYQNKHYNKKPNWLKYLQMLGKKDQQTSTINKPKEDTSCRVDGKRTDYK